LQTVDRLIASFYILDDEARNEILKIMDLKAETHTDAERANSRKALK
jgi:hypothetical protein